MFISLSYCMFSFFWVFHLSHLRLSFSLDINIWLVTFGFHLHNAIPGFPIPKFDLTQPSLEMKKSQLWDDLPVSISSTIRHKGGVRHSAESLLSQS